MSTESRTISVPATTANIGPGFDCLGAALTLYNQFTFTPLNEEPGYLEIVARGDEADRVQTTDSNLVYQAFSQFYQGLKQLTPAVKIEIDLGVPLARGLGSSATAIVGGLVGANALAGLPLSQTAVMQMAIAMEGHPDNVVPALLGGCRLAATGLETDWEICEVGWHESLATIVAIPNFELPTAEARRVLPDSYSRADAIFNTAHLGLLLRGLATGQPNWLKAALQDRIHQPYRQSLIPGYQTVQTAALKAGAYGMVISGAGPTLLAIADRVEASRVQAAMQQAWTEIDIAAQVYCLSLDPRGAVIVPSV